LSEEQEASCGFSLRRLASSGDTLVGLPRHHEELKLGQRLTKPAVSGDERVDMAGPGNDPVQVYRTGRANHWEFLRLWTGFELSSSWTALPCYGPDLNRNILDFMS
jgi:hypothetical protein